ncbi:MAG TPA: response regulator [Egibacteraceae bacterium]|nr:response regulator [Egibacteraceae bacterium]
MTGPGGRVLLVEDEPRIAAFLVKGLQGDGCDVVVAEDGEVGLYLATAESFDAVILDIGLPGLHGVEVLRGIRRARPALPVVMLTARDEPDARDVCMQAGATGFVTKPLVFADLRAVLAACISSGAG